MRSVRFVTSLLLLLHAVLIARAASNSFINFETAPVHPLALSPDGNTLAVCNLQDARVELFDLTQPTPRRIASIPTGLDPVTARFNSRGELWIANHISDSVTIYDPFGRKVVATLQCFDGPADIVFKDNTAWITAAGTNTVEIWSVPERRRTGTISIQGDRRSEEH